MSLYTRRVTVLRAATSRADGISADKLIMAALAYNSLKLDSESTSPTRQRANVDRLRTSDALRASVEGTGYPQVGCFSVGGSETA